MFRILLIRFYNGSNFPTYGVKKVRNNMKFPFIIRILIWFLWCGISRVECRVPNGDLKYLEYLNDLDRENVELDDIHQQWPFVNSGSQMHQERRNEDEEETDNDKEKLMEALNLAKVELAKDPINCNRHRQKFIEDGFKHLRDTYKGREAIDQYRRYNKPMDYDYDTEKNYERSDLNFNDDNEDDEEVLTQIRPQLPRVFPRIATMGKPLIFDNSYRESFDDDNQEDNRNSEEIGDEVLDEEIRIPLPKPSFSTAYFPRIAPVDIPFTYKIDDFYLNNNQNNNHDNQDHHQNHHHDDDYQIKKEEEFPQSLNFDQIPIAENPSEFGVGPNDPRFYRNLNKADADNDEVTTLSAESSSSKQSKTDSRINSRQQSEDLPEIQLGSFAINKEVEVVPFKPDSESDPAGVYIIAIVAGISAAATVALIAVGIGWYNLQKHLKNAEDTDYPSYGIVGPNKDYDKKNRDEIGDKRLAQSAQMYHYQHQKQQIIAMGRNPQGHGSQSDSDEEEDEEGNYTVYECPGLASIEGPLEVKNPMFDDDQLATPQTTNQAANSANK